MFLRRISFDFSFKMPNLKTKSALRNELSWTQKSSIKESETTHAMT